MREGNPKMLWGAVVVLLFAIMLVQHVTDPIQLKINPPPKAGESSDLLVQLPGQFMVASMTGFKEVIASALWVRADTFFHSGQYDAIVPIVRLVTWLDPHNLDVFTTGAWHLDYNFVDANQMSDKRYIPASIALLKEGIKNNPKIWDLYFELGWTHYLKKLQDNETALEYMEKACTLDGRDPNTGKKMPRPEYVDRMLAHQYEKVGRFDDAIRQWEKARKRIPKDDTSSLDVCDHNLGLLLLRMGWRYGDMDAYKRGVEVYNRLASRKGAPPVVVEAAKAAEADYKRRLAANNPPSDARKPLDAGFDVKFAKDAPRIFRISGKLNLARASEYKDLASESFTHWYRDNEASPADQRVMWRDGCRVKWMLCDYDYKLPEVSTFSYKIDKTKTIIWDSLYVQGGAFNEKIDLSQNPDFYPFKGEKFRLIVSLSPIQPDTPDYIQDRIGWKGEALTDKNYLDTKTLPGFRCLRKEIILDRKDLL